MNYNTISQRYKHAVYIMKSKPKSVWTLVILGFFAEWVITAAFGRVAAIAFPINLGLSAGVALVCLKTLRHEDASAGDLFSAFKDWKSVKRVIGGQLYMFLRVYIWGAVPIILAALLNGEVISLGMYSLSFDMFDDGISFGSILCMVTAIIVSCIFVVIMIIKSIEYSFVPYILVSREDVGVFEACDESKKLTYGIKGRMFLAAFIPALAAAFIMGVIGALCFIPVVGGLFMIPAAAFLVFLLAVLPYFLELVYAGFYDAALTAPKPQYGGYYYYSPDGQNPPQQPINPEDKPMQPAENVNEPEPEPEKEDEESPQPNEAEPVAEAESADDDK